MRKAILVLILIFVSVILMALSRDIAINSEEVELNFNNVKLINLEFYDGKKVQVKYSEQNVNVNKEDNKLLIASQALNEAKVELFLPEDKQYLINRDGVSCRFDKNKVSITTEEGENIHFENGKLSVTNDKTKESVIVNSEGVYVHDNDETVSISAEGIKVEGEKNTDLTGFWGQVLGGFVRLIVKGSLAAIGDSPEQIVKHFVNDDPSLVDIDWSEGENFVTKKITKTFEPSPGELFDVHNLNGSIKLSSWNNDYAEVLAVLSSDKGDDQIEQLEVEILHEKHWILRTNVLINNVQAGCDYEIKIPEFLKLNNVETSNGSIDIENVKGDISLRSSNGSLEIVNLEGELEAFTSNGNIIAENITGKTNVTSSNGRINIKQVPKIKNVITSNGSITAEIVKLNNDVLLSTSNSNINLFLPQDINARVNANTSNASVNVQSLKIVSEYVTNSKLDGIIGKGGYKITANTSNSSININKL